MVCVHRPGYHFKLFCNLIVIWKDVINVTVTWFSHLVTGVYMINNNVTNNWRVLYLIAITACMHACVYNLTLVGIIS